MSTTPNVTTEHVSDNFSAELVTYVAGYPKKELEKPEAERKLKVLPETADEVSEENIEAGEFTVVFKQTARFYFPNNITGVTELIKNDEEVVNLVFSALKVKLANKLRSRMNAKSFEPVDGVIDFFDECSEVSSRNLTPIQKAEKTIGELNLSESDRKRLVELLLSTQQAAQ